MFEDDRKGKPVRQLADGKWEIEFWEFSQTSFPAEEEVVDELLSNE